VHYAILLRAVHAFLNILYTSITNGPITGEDPGFFLREVAPLRNDLTDGGRKQIFKANNEDEGLYLSRNIM